MMMTMMTILMMISMIRIVMSRCSSPTMTEKDGGREGGGQCPPPPRSYRWQFSQMDVPSGVDLVMGWITELS